MSSECTCNPTEYPFYCERHQCRKTEHWHTLCKTKSSYRSLWDKGKGPGQPSAPLGPLPLQGRRKGVGDHLKDVTTELKLTMKQGCNCNALATRMNNLGPDGCRWIRAELVDALKKNAQKYTWGDVAKAAAKALTTELGWRIDLLDPYGSLLDEAIRRTEAELQAKELAQLVPPHVEHGLGKVNGA